MAESRGVFSADTATRVILIGGFLLVLGVNAPGHLSYDSIAQLHEGHFGVRETWGPALYAWLLGFFDHIVPGAGLYLTFSAAILFAGLLSLRPLRPTVSWLAPPLALAFVLSPVVLVYQGIIWKDVLMANLVVTGFICLAHAAKGWTGDRRRRALLLATAVLLLAIAALVRQNGVVVVPMAALAAGWTARRPGWRSALTWGGGFLLATLLVIKVLGWAAEPPGEVEDVAINRGVRIVQQYDIVGAVAEDPTIPLGRLAAADPAYETVVRGAVKAYSPERVDTFDRYPAFAQIWLAPDAAVALQWREIILHHPDAYLAHRFEVFRQLMAPPVQEVCLPLHVGIAGRESAAVDMNLALEEERRDRQLFNYATWFFYTPVFSHLAYGVLALIVLGLVMIRRDPADYVIAALMVGVLGFAATFFIISIACDYRYVYALDLAAMAGLLYVALDPPRLRLRRQGR